MDFIEILQELACRLQMYVFVLIIWYDKSRSSLYFQSIDDLYTFSILYSPSQIAKVMGPTRGPPGSCRPQMGPMSAPWTLISGFVLYNYFIIISWLWSIAPGWCANKQVWLLAACWQLLILINESIYWRHLLWSSYIWYVVIILAMNHE